MRIIKYWRYPACGGHAAAYLGQGLVAVPAKYGNRLTVWNVSELHSPRLVADLPDRPDCQAAAVCNGFLLVGSDRGIESMRFSPDEVSPLDCSTFAPAVNDFEVVGDTALAVSKTNRIKAVRVGKDGRLTDVGMRENVLARCHGASHEGQMVAVTGFKRDGEVERPLGLFPEAIDQDGRLTDPAGWTMINNGEPQRWYMNISNRIILHRRRAYIARGAITLMGKKGPRRLDPALVVLDVHNPAEPVLLGNYPCLGSTTCTGLHLDRQRDCLIVGSSNIVRRFEIDGDLLRESDRIAFPYGDVTTGPTGKSPSVHDVCKTDLVHDGLPVFAAGGQQHDDLYLFTV